MEQFWVHERVFVGAFLVTIGASRDSAGPLLVQAVVDFGSSTGEY